VKTPILTVFFAAILCACNEGGKSGGRPEPKTHNTDLPALYFGPGGEAKFAELMARPVHQPIREDVLKRAAQFTDPKSPFFIDEADIMTSMRRVLAANALPECAGRVLGGAAETLAAAAVITGEEAPRDKGARLLEVIATALPVDREPMSSQVALFRGEMARGIGVAHALFAGRLEPEARRRVAAEGRKYMENLLAEAEEPAWFYPYSNWTGVSIGGAGVLALALAEDFPNEAPRWIERSKKLVGDYLTASYGPEGDYAEHGYLEYAMAHTSMFAAALANSGDRSLIDHPHFKAIARWRVFNSLPGSTALDPRNSTGYRAEVFAIPWPLLFAREHNNPEILWLWEKSNLNGNDFPLVPWKHSDSRGLSPLRAIWAPENMTARAPADAPAYGYFSGRGLAIWRGGISKDAFFFSIDASKAFPTTHDHADAGSFNLYSGGVAWATDAGKGDRGPGTPSDGNSHSIVQIDGKSQAFTGGGLTSGGKVVTQEDHARFGRVTIDATEAYNFSLERIQHTGKVEARKVHHNTAAGARQAIRHSVVLKDANSSPWAVVILDDIRKDDAPHAFVWQMVTEEANTATPDGHHMALHRDGEALDLFAWSPEGGAWSSAPLPLKESHVKTPPLAAVKFTTQATNPEFAVVLIPRRPGEPAAQVSFESAAEAVAIRLTRGAESALVRWSGEGGAPSVEIPGS
jgi:hypothetical protein